MSEGLSNTRTQSTIADPNSLLISDREAAFLCRCSRSHWHTLRAADKVPPSVKLGRAVRWRRAEIEAWIAAGCPDGPTWAAMTAKARLMETLTADALKSGFCSGHSPDEFRCER